MVRDKRMFIKPSIFPDLSCASLSEIISQRRKLELFYAVFLRMYLLFKVELYKMSGARPKSLMLAACAVVPATLLKTLLFSLHLISTAVKLQVCQNMYILRP